MMESNVNSVQDYFQNSTLLTKSFVNEESMYRDQYLGLSLLLTCLAVWICVTNASQIINIVMTPELRGQPRNVLLANVCVAELFMGVFLCPMYIDLLLMGTWRNNLTTSTFYEVLFYCQSCISITATIVMVVERIYYMLTPYMMEGSGKRCITLLLVLLPWISGVSSVIPLFVLGIKLDSERNLYQWRQKFQPAVVFAGFICPIIVLTLMTASAWLFSEVSNMKAKKNDTGPNQERKLMKQSLQVAIVSSIAVAFLQLPLFTAMLSAMFCPNNHGVGSNRQRCGKFDQTTWTLVTVLMMVKAGVTPFIWLIYKDVRIHFKLILSLRFCSGLFGFLTDRGFNFRRRRDEEDQADNLETANGSQQVISSSSSF